MPGFFEILQGALLEMLRMRHSIVESAVILCLCCITFRVSADEARDYELTDPDLKTVHIDSSPNESFLSIRADTNGRLFVGGREALFLYEPDENGGYKPRKELYRFPPHSWIYDIALSGPDVYLLTLSALYVLKDGAIKTEGLKTKRLLWGVPLGHVHQCFHGLAWGPEGDLYISMGDPLWYYGDFNRPDHWGHWTFFSRSEKTSKQGERKKLTGGAASNWHRTPYTGVGGVFRIRPDGTRFQIVARGLRNSCGLCFDSNWNLFTNDNDHEGMPHLYVPGRLNYVAPYSDFSWPRGWMRSMTPDRADLLDTINTKLGRFVPVGQTYYDETFLPEKYRNNLLVARWGTRSITRYPLKQRGASFTAEEYPLLVGRNQARPVGVAVGRGGRIFATIAYMAHNEGSPVYRSDLIMITRADDTPAHPFKAYDSRTAPVDKLVDELRKPSWWRRYRAHEEILRRIPDEKLSEESLIWRIGKETIRAPHRIWLMAELTYRRIWLRYKHDPESVPLFSVVTWGGLAETVKSDDKWIGPSLRLQSIRALTEYYPDQGIAAFRSGLRKTEPPIQHSALVGLIRGNPTTGNNELIPVVALTFDDLISGPAQSSDSYVRQAAAFLLAEKASIEQLQKLCVSDRSKMRLAGVLAVGSRLTLPPATIPVAAKAPLAPWRSQDAYTIQYAEEKLDLRQFGRVGTFTVAEHWKALAHTDEQKELFALLKARLADEDEQVRLQASHFLSLLNDSRTEPLIAKLYRETEQRRLAIAAISHIPKLWTIGPFSDQAEGFATIHAVEKQAIDVASKHELSGRTLEWKKQTRIANRMFDFGGDGPAPNLSSYYAFCRIESATRQQIMLLIGSDDGVKVWMNGRDVIAKVGSRGALPFQDVVYVDLQPGGNDLLIRVQNISGECALYLHYRSLTDLSVTLPEKLGITTLAERLKEAASGSSPNRIPPELLNIDWTEATTKGDAERGRKLFSADGIGCAKCHAATKQSATTGGPSLAGASKRFTIPYLVESVLLPSKKISPVFRSTLIVTKDGKVHTGLITSESADKVNMLTIEAKRIEILKADIDERKQQETSPMPAGVIKKPEELRDILAFLLRGT